MAAVSAWTKPGAWALDSEEHEAATAAASAAATVDKGYSSSDSHQSADFPSLSAAAVTKIPKKKKKQTLSLAEFTTGAAVAPGSGKFQPSSKTLMHEDLLALPTGPRERSEEELQRSRGFGYGGRGGGARVSDEMRRGPPREPRESGPSRADEADDWGSTKKPVAGGGFERRERERGFFDSQSRADESDSWVSKKGPTPPMSDGRRERRGFDFNREGMNGNGVDSDTWGRKREGMNGNGVDSDTWGRRREGTNGNGGDSDTWGKKREDDVVSGRPRLVLQPRTLPVVNGVNLEEKKVANGVNGEEKEGVEVKTKGANPFGQARPREEVLKEKGKDWKEIDEKLDAVKIQEAAPLVGRRAFGAVTGAKEDRTERAWRKPAVNEASMPPRYVCFDLL